jgi:hypothetical protein
MAHGGETGGVLGTLRAQMLGVFDRIASRWKAYGLSGEFAERVAQPGLTLVWRADVGTFHIASTPLDDCSIAELAAAVFALEGLYTRIALAREGQDRLIAKATGALDVLRKFDAAIEAREAKPTPGEA